MTFVSVNAPAKVNLYLHVTGKRADGYHLLDSLFVFAADGDVVTVGDSDGLTLDITGNYAGSLSNGEDNIVIKAARALAKAAGVQQTQPRQFRRGRQPFADAGHANGFCRQTRRHVRAQSQRDFPHFLIGQSDVPQSRQRLQRRRRVRRPAADSRRNGQIFFQSDRRFRFDTRCCWSIRTVPCRRPPCLNRARPSLPPPRPSRGK